MKRIAILLLILSATCSVAYGQTWSVGVGLNRQKTFNGGLEWSDGVLVGGQYEYHFQQSRWSAAAGVQYSCVKFYYELDHRIHIPLTAGFNVFSAGIIDVGIYAGPAFAVGIFSRLNYIGGGVRQLAGERDGEQNNQIQRTSLNEYWEEYSPFEMMLCGGVSVDVAKKIRLKSGYTYSLESRYGHRQYWDISLFYLF